MLLFDLLILRSVPRFPVCLLFWCFRLCCRRAALLLSLHSCLGGRLAFTLKARCHLNRNPPFFRIENFHPCMCTFIRYLHTAATHSSGLKGKAFRITCRYPHITKQHNCRGRIMHAIALLILRQKKFYKIPVIRGSSGLQCIAGRFS